MIDIEKKTFLGAKFSDYGVNAKEINISLMGDINVPDQIRDEIPTLNRMGYMKKTLDEYSRSFVDHALKSNELLLEIGCAYGYVVGEVLKHGGRIIASDLSEDHLKVTLKNTPQDRLGNLYLYPGSFPKDINLPKSSLGAVLTSRVMHFLKGEEIERGLRKINEWLVPNGKFYFTAVSPYHASVREKFLPIYKKRVEEQIEWPGVIENHWSIAPMHEPYVEQFLNVFDLPQLSNLLPKHGFRIDKINLFSYQGDTTSGDIGHIGFVATKI